MSNAFLYSEVNAMCILFLLLLSVKVKRSMFLQEQRQLFFKVALTNIALLLIDLVWIFVNDNVIGVTVLLNWLLNGCYYILGGILGFCWFAYSETVQESRLVRDKRCLWLSHIPIFVLVIFTLLSLKTGWFFYIDTQNVYHRGPLFALQLLIAYGYVVFTAVKAFCLSFRTDNYRRKSELRALSFYVLPTLLAGGFQILFPNFPILCIGNTLGLLYVYLTLQEQLISLDALTKLNNRNQLFQYLSVKLLHPRENKDLYLLMIDVDFFKSINDQYGHVEGDRALRAVANCLMKVCSNRNYFISRYGGDEFVVICELETGSSTQPVSDAIRTRLGQLPTPYSLTVSIGCAKYTSDIKNQQELIERADRELYKVKKSRP